MTTEEWRQAIGHEGYEVSDQGRVRSYWRQNGTVGSVPRILAPATLKSGHLLLSMRKRRYAYVHQMVAEAFIGPRPEGAQVCHGNSDPADNRLSNLRYDTPRGNTADRAANGTWPARGKNGNAKLTEAQVAEIRQHGQSSPLSRHGLSRELAPEFGVSPQTVYAVLSGRSWGTRG